MNDLNKKIDYAQLEETLVPQDITRAAELAKDHGFRSICVNSANVRQAHLALLDSEIKTISTVAFPLGQTGPSIKAREAEYAIKNGADEIDMVINISYLKTNDQRRLKEEVNLVKEVAKGRVLKVIIETCLLTDEEKIRAAEILKEIGVDYIMTSTGFVGSGASLADVKLLKEACGDELKVKASGGIKTKGFALQLIEAGADLIGTSSVFT